MRHGDMAKNAHPGRIAMLFVCAVSVAALAAPAERALSEYQKREWQVEDGLPQGNVRTITQSPDGALLVGTGGGMASFDGVRFKPLKVDEHDESANEPVNALLYARNGDLWIGTDGRGVIHRTAQGSVSVSEASGLSQERVRALYEDAGVIWVATQNGVERITSSAGGDRVECLTALGIVPGDFTTPFASDGAGGMLIVTAKGLFHWTSGAARLVPLSGQATAIYRDARGRIWAGTQRGVLLLTRRGAGFTEQMQPGTHGPVASLMGDREGTLWIGTRGHGICRISSTGVGHWTSAEGLPDSTLRSMFEDNEGNLWFGMLSGGLSRWRETVMIPYGRPEGLPESFAANVLADRSGELWLGTWGQGLFRLHQGQLVRVPLPGAPMQVPIRALAQDGQDGMWIGTWYDGLYHFDGHSATRFLTGSESLANAVSALLVDRAGSLWVGTYRGLLKYERGRPEPGREQVLLPGKLITALKESPTGEILVGTTQGLYLLDGTFVSAFTKRNGMSQDAVLSISIDGSGAIWVGTKAGGLDRIAGRKVISLPAGAMPALPIFGVLDDGRGELWMGSSRGVLRVSRNQFHDLSEGRIAKADFTVFGRNDGMRSSECVGISQPPTAMASDGSLWFATASGFVHTDPARSLRALEPPPIRVTKLLLDHVERPMPPSVSIPAGANEVEFQFEAIRLADPGQLRFRYKLENYDADWSETGSRHVVFKHLPAGRYRLIADVRDHLGPWSKNAAVIDVRQLPYVYQQWWFYALLAALTAAAIVAIFRWKIARTRSRVALILEERNRIAREWHDTLMANFAAISWQLEATRNRLATAPHEVEPSLELSRNMVKHCMAQARRVIWDLRDHSEPVGLLSEELSKALTAMGARAELDTQLSIEGSERPLPPVFVHHLVCIGQEAVTNALRHGSPQTVTIRVIYGGGGLSMTVRDNGRGFLPAEPAHATVGHFGLAVMHERAKKIGGDLKICSAPGAGTEVLVNVPGASIGEDHHP